ncbi:hypothetical protein WAF17_04395 [Bernardetia sp. ABR2-2B]|uniref:hypothetical protein n=1 Tax=Bernardetia sp. ABR2-2B TaxID=3127472 RepID=UPI0030D216AD
MINQERITIQPRQLLKLIGVGVFMFWFLNYLDSSISATLKTIFMYLPAKFNFNALIAYPINDFTTLCIVLFVFFMLVKNIKQNYENENYHKKMIVLFIIGIIILAIYLAVSPSAIAYFFIEVLDSDINKNYGESYVPYIGLGTYAITTIIKLTVVAYVFLKNTNFQNSSTSL